MFVFIPIKKCIYIYELCFQFTLYVVKCITKFTSRKYQFAKEFYYFVLNSNTSTKLYQSLMRFNQYFCLKNQIFHRLNIVIEKQRQIQILYFNTITMTKRNKFRNDYVYIIIILNYFTKNLMEFVCAIRVQKFIVDYKTLNNQSAAVRNVL